MPHEKNVLMAIAALVLFALGTALLSQHVFDMQPCAWCVLQRIIYLVILLIVLIGLAAPVARRAALALVTFIGATGAGVAILQITVASKSLSCDRTLADRIITGSGLDELVPGVFGVYASCLDAAVDLLGIEYAVWSLMLFVALAVASASTLVLSCRWRRNRG